MLVSLCSLATLALGCGDDSTPSGTMGSSTTAADGSTGTSASDVASSGASSQGGDATSAQGGAGGDGAGDQGGAGGRGEGGDGEGGEPFTGVCGAELYNPLKNVYWGDLHVHTSYSIDSFVFGNRNDPAAAYSLARGDASLPLNSGNGGTATATLEAPLDFAAVTDHGEFLTIAGQCTFGDPGNEDLCETLNDQGAPQQTVQMGLLLARLAAVDPPPLPGCSGANEAACVQAAQNTWERAQQAADAAYAPCTFTSLYAYEWTATTGAANLHRNVIFGTTSVPDVPLDYLHYPTPLALWQGLDATCRADDGCDVITIPHNSNLSNGTMWDTADDPVSREYMRRYQVLVEMAQHKGASECAPGAPLSDPDCDFEDADGGDPDANGPGYVRNGLARGLMLQDATGANPLQMGVIGSTDTHNGAPGYTQENGWNGHAAGTDDTPEARLDQATFAPGALAAVWAPENTREEIYAALKRREAYATSGPRIVVRFFALDDVDDAAAADFCADPELPRRLVEAGAQPMGAEVHAMVRPRFFVAGAAAGTPLERLDLVRLGLDEQGEPALQLRSVALEGSDQATFCKSFTEGDGFDPEVPWLYYARVLESAKPRWSALDCAVAPDHPSCSDPAIPTTVKDRAWTSAIFVSP